MATIVDYSSLLRSPTRTTDCGCGPAACPECGGLECLCRPRFFAGQVLTDEDFRRLDHYIVEKQKLHNRHLVGAGIVCGLEVLCHSCLDQVVVRPGYAISPCGEDIVVCEETTVAVCDLISACKEQERRERACEPYPYNPGTDCQDRCVEWVLSIRYDEKPSRGVMPLKNGKSPCCSSCSGSSGSSGSSGGKASSCGCGCHEKLPTKTSNSSSKRQCEPTAVCEGFRFEMSRMPPSRLRGATSETADGFRRSLSALQGVFPPQPNLRPNPEEWYAWCCDTKAALREFLRNYGTYDCDADDRLANLICPRPIRDREGPNYTDYVAEIQANVHAMREIASTYLRACLCSALLPPCSSPVDDPRVPIAVVTICGDGCHITKVCNGNVRRYVTTFPLIQHYFAAFGLDNILNAALSKICCGDDERAVEEPEIVAWKPTKTRMLMRERSETEQAADFGRLVIDALGRPDRVVNPARVLAAALGGLDDDGNPVATPLELEQPLQALLAHNVAGPILRSFIPAETTRVVQPYAARAAGAIKRNQLDRDQEMATMREELDSLRDLAGSQQARIDALLNRMRDKG